MGITSSRRWYQMFGMALLFLLQMLCVASAFAADISGTVINSSGKTGRVYLLVGSQFGITGYGVSIDLAKQTSYTIRGVPNGNYTVIAEMDALNTGVPHASDPFGQSAPFTVSGSPVTSIDVTLVSPTAPVIASPLSAPGGTASAEGVVVQLNNHPRNNNGILLADSYNFYWNTDGVAGSIIGGGKRNIPANDRGPLILRVPTVAVGATYFFSVAPVIGGTEVTAMISAVSSPITVQDPAGGISITGTVDLSNSTIAAQLGAATPLYVAAVDDNAGIFITAKSTPEAKKNPYIIKGVQPGNYKIYAILDIGDKGYFDFATYLNDGNDKSQPIVVVPINSNANLTAADITLTPANSVVKVRTVHSLSNGFEGYSLEFNANGVNKQVVNVELTSGHQISGPMDISTNTDGRFGIFMQVPDRPQLGASYPMKVSYSDGTSDQVAPSVTAVLDSFAGTVYPGPGMAISSGQNPGLSFAWSPVSVPGYYTYSASLSNGGGNNSAQPMTRVSAAYQGNTPAPGSYSWYVTVEDDHGNQAQRQSSTFTVDAATSPTVTGFSPAAGPIGTSVTINGSGFTGTPIVKFNGCTAATPTNITATSLTAVVPNTCASGGAGAPSVGPITVTVGSITAVSSSEFYPTIGFSGTVQTSASAAVSTGVTTVSMVENPAITAVASNTGTGAYSIPNISASPGIPSGIPASMRISSTSSNPAYLDSYTALITNRSDVTTGTYTLFSAVDLSTWGATPASGKGLIKTSVQDYTNNITTARIAGATVIATSKMHPDLPYAGVKYTNGSNTITTDTSTDASGRFFVLDVDDGDYVEVTASKAGYGFLSRTFVTRANAVSQTGVRGAALAASSVSLAGGIYTGPQQVSFTLVKPSTWPASIPAPTWTDYDVVYTTNGNDPAVVGGSAYNNASGTSFITIPATATLRFAARNKWLNAAVENPSNSVSYTIKSNQTIIIQSPAPQTAPYNSNFNVSASAPGGLVIYSSGSPSVCTNIGSTFTMVSGSGTCIVQYDQPGNATHNAAPQLTNSVTATTIASTTSIALTSGASTSNVGDSLTFSATVSGAAATPSGTVTFLDGVSSLGTFPLSSGFASVVTSALTAGSHSISVSYGGDGNYAGSTSLNLAQNVVATSLQAIYNSLLPATPTTQMDIFLLASAPLDLFSAGRDITVSIKGGYADTGHTELNRTVTTIQGPTFVTAGKVVMENIAVK